VIGTFATLSKAAGVEFEGYYRPGQPGVAIFGPFIAPPPGFDGREVDVALSHIDPGLPARIGKEAFVVTPDGDPSWPISHALAVGFPTAFRFVAGMERTGASANF
jgi:hypothetical protein